MAADKITLHLVSYRDVYFFPRSPADYKTLLRLRLPLLRLPSDSMPMLQTILKRSKIVLKISKFDSFVKEFQAELKEKWKFYLEVSGHSYKAMCPIENEAHLGRIMKVLNTFYRRFSFAGDAALKRSKSQTRMGMMAVYKFDVKTYPELPISDVAEKVQAMSVAIHTSSGRRLSFNREQSRKFLTITQETKAGDSWVKVSHMDVDPKMCKPEDAFEIAKFFWILATQAVEAQDKNGKKVEA